jgi:hypothetical protein
MKKWCLFTFQFCLCILLAVALLSVASIADILSRQVRGNGFTLFLDGLFLFSEGLILKTLHDIFIGTGVHAV